MAGRAERSNVFLRIDFLEKVEVVRNKVVGVREPSNIFPLVEELFPLLQALSRMFLHLGKHIWCFTDIRSIIIM